VIALIILDALLWCFALILEINLTRQNYDSGQLDAELIVFLLVIPIGTLLASTVLPLFLRWRGHRTAAWVLSALGLAIFAVYFGFQAMLVAL
jgi:hypothetical protein